MRRACGKAGRAIPTPANRWWIAAAAVLAASAPALAEEPQRGGTLTFAVVGEPNTHDCHAANSFSVLHYVAPHYSTLLKVDAAHYPRITGDLAESWSVSEDGRAYTFKIRQGVLFHDGTTLTSEDVRASLERIRKPPAGIISVRSGTWTDVEAIEAPDPQTVTVRLKQPDSGMLATFANPFSCIFSAKRLAEDPNFPAKNVMGTGPFVFVERQPGSHWVGQRFEKYFQPGKPYLDGFRAVLTTGPALATSLAGGQVQAEFRGLAPAERDRVVAAQGDRIRIQESDWVSMYMVVFNATKPPFNDARVRRALSLAIDRWGGSPALSRITIIKSVGGLLRPGSEFAASAEELAQLPGFGRDIGKSREEAKRLLAEAGVKDLSFKLSNRTIQHPYVVVGTYLIDQWRQIGVNVEHVTLETGPWQQALNTASFDAIIDFSGEPMDEPGLILAKYLSYDLSPNNTSHAIDRTLDDLYDRQRRAQDAAERRRVIRDFEKWALTEAYMAPTLWAQRIVAHAANLRGWPMTPSHFLDQSLADVWFAK
jgi:peptide/nickel transport system substrate-binding protein